MTASQLSTRRGWSGGDAVEFLALQASNTREVHVHDAVCPGPEGATRVRDHLMLTTFYSCIDWKPRDSMAQ